MNDENQKIVKCKYESYINGEITHDEYYLWLASFVGTNERLVPFKMNTLLRSKDPYLNDLSLEKFDVMQLIIEPMAFRKNISWSLSDTVCCLKAVARKMITNYRAGSFNA